MNRDLGGFGPEDVEGDRHGTSVAGATIPSPRPPQIDDNESHARRSTLTFKADWAGVCWGRSRIASSGTVTIWSPPRIISPASSGLRSNTNASFGLFPQPPAPFGAGSAPFSAAGVIAPRSPESLRWPVQRFHNVPFTHLQDKFGLEPTHLGRCTTGRTAPLRGIPQLRSSVNRTNSPLVARASLAVISGRTRALFPAGTRSLLSGHCAIPCAFVRICPFSQSCLRSHDSHPCKPETRRRRWSGRGYPAQLDAPDRNGPMPQCMIGWSRHQLPYCRIIRQDPYNPKYCRIPQAGWRGISPNRTRRRNRH